MKASETRQKAREFLKTLSGKYQLFLVSIILAILTISISYTETYHINGTTVNATASVPGIVSILSALFLASASYAVLDVFATNVTMLKWETTCVFSQMKYLENM